jgi:hypothetical protein
MLRARPLHALAPNLEIPMTQTASITCDEHACDDPEPKKILRWRLPSGREGKTGPLPVSAVEMTLEAHRARPNGIALWAVNA